MRVIQTQAEVGEDRTLLIRLPADMPTGPVDVLVVLEPHHRPATAEERRAAARAGRGALKDLDISTEELLAERRAEESRREETLGQ